FLIPPMIICFVIQHRLKQTVAQQMQVAVANGTKVLVLAHESSNWILKEEFNQHTSKVTTLAFDAEGEKLASGDEGGKIVYHRLVK
ncbi:MAG: WD40 domain-containing protein, partial [Planctomycetes bacterium]|nr:WD40 domain-containing protein [Planctomycetota bacterium]